MSSAVARKTNWKQDPEKVRHDIVVAATRLFAESGFNGTKLEDVAAQTDTSKRMIYYYFGDKQGLYQSVLENVYQTIRESEASVDVRNLDPRAALVKLIENSFEHNRAHPEYVRLLMIENVHQAKTLASSEFIQRLRTEAKTVLEEVYERGLDQGVFRAGIDPLQVRWMFSGLSFFNISNKPSFSALFGDQLYSDTEQQRLKSAVTQLVLRYVLVDPDSTL